MLNYILAILILVALGLVAIAPCMLSSELSQREERRRNDVKAVAEDIQSEQNTGV